MLCFDLILSDLCQSNNSGFKPTFDDSYRRRGIIIFNFILISIMTLFIFLGYTGTSSSEEDSVVHVNLPSGDSPLSDTLVSLDLLWHLLLIKVNLFYFSQSFV